jgi:hypothetical protein
MTWKDLLPEIIYDRTEGEVKLSNKNEKRACPSCFWGDYKSVRMLKDDSKEKNQKLCPEHVKSGSCGLNKIDNMKVID